MGRHKAFQIRKSRDAVRVEAEARVGLYLGFNKSCTPEEIRQGILDGNIENTLSFREVAEDDSFFIPAAQRNETLTASGNLKLITVEV